MPMSFPGAIDNRDISLSTIHRALDLGITLLDTANCYAPTWDSVGHNEALVAEALRTYAGPADVGGVLVTTKGGITRGPHETWGRDSRVDALKAACEASLVQLGVPAIELYQHHRHDPSMDYRAQMASLRALKENGLIKRIGLSNINLGELLVAIDELGGPDEGGVVSVQNEYSPRYRGERNVLDLCTDLGIAFLPWSPLGGSELAHEAGAHFAEFASVGAEFGASPQETVLAWLLELSPVIIPIPGATKPRTVESIVAAADIQLTPTQSARLSATDSSSVSMYPDNGPRSPLDEHGPT